MATLQFNGKLPTIHKITELLINEAIKRSDGDRNDAARTLGISKHALIGFLKRYGRHAKHLTMALILLIISIGADAHADAGYAEGKVVVNFRAGTSRQAIIDMADMYNLEISDTIPQINYYVFSITSDVTVDDMVSVLSEHEIVEKCEPNYFTNTQDVPNDSLFDRQWSLDNPDYVNSDLHILEAWDIEPGSPDIIVAVIDMGFDITHEDLQESIWNNSDEIPGNGTDDDGNGYVDDIVGWDFVNQTNGLNSNDCDWQDEDNDPTTLKSSHGNRVLGLIGATTGNGIGIAGIASNCKTMLIRAGFYNAEGYQVLSTSAIIKGIIYAADNGARVINISSGSNRYSSSYKSALEYATNNGVLVVCSAGNEGSSSACYPAAYDIPGLISVGASTTRDGKCSFSNYGNWVDVSAPGQYIVTTLLNDSYGETQGTSFAAPMVSGIAALIFSKYPDWTSAQVHDQIMNTVDVCDSLSGANITSGRVNAYRAISNVQEADTASDREQNDTGVGETSDTSAGSDASDGGGGCFIVTTSDNSRTGIQLTVIMIIGIFAACVAGRKIH